MSNSLRDQLLGLGFKTAPKPEKKFEDRKPLPAENKHVPAGKPVPAHAAGKHRPNHKPSARPVAKPDTRSQEEIDLAKAYALRAETEKQERIAAEKRKQEEARIKRELKQNIQELLKDQGLNVESAELVRHFEYNGKIRRIYATPEQLASLNKGLLGVVQLDGRYLLVTAELALKVKELLPAIVALLVDPNAPASDDPYSDPLYQVPDDLVW